MEGSLVFPVYTLVGITLHLIYFQKNFQKTIQNKIGRKFRRITPLSTSSSLFTSFSSVPENKSKSQLKIEREKLPHFIYISHISHNTTRLHSIPFKPNFTCKILISYIYTQAYRVFLPWSVTYFTQAHYKPEYQSKKMHFHVYWKSNKEELLIHVYPSYIQTYQKKKQWVHCWVGKQVAILYAHVYRVYILDISVHIVNKQKNPTMKKVVHLKYKFNMYTYFVLYTGW